MSGQLDEQQLHRLFKTLLALFDMVVDNDWPLPPKIPQALVHWHKELGSKPWIDNYERTFTDLIESAIKTLENVVGDLLSILIGTQRVEPSERVKHMKRLWWFFDTTNEAESIKDAKAMKIYPAIMQLRCAVIKFVCHLRLQEPIESLIEKAKNYDCEAIANLVKLDPTFIETNYCRQAIQEATLRRDSMFFAFLSRSLKPSQRFWSLKGKRQYFAFYCLYNLGDFAKRKNADWSAFLIQHGFMQYGESNNVRRQRERYGLTKSSVTKST